MVFRKILWLVAMLMMYDEDDDDDDDFDFHYPNDNVVPV